MWPGPVWNCLIHYKGGSLQGFLQERLEIAFKSWSQTDLRPLSSTINTFFLKTCPLQHKFYLQAHLSLFLSTEWTGYSPPCGQREKKTPSMSEVLPNCGCSWCCLALRWQCVGFLGDLLTGMEYAVSSSPLSVPNTVPGIGGSWTTNGCDGREVVSFSLKLILGDRHLLPL